MVRWKDRLDLRILILVVTLPLVGVLAVSLGVLNLIRSGFVDVARRQSESTAEIITHNIERTMVAGQVDITRSMVKDMRLMAGVEGLDLLNDEGREAFSKEAAPKERDALVRLRAEGGAFSVQRAETLVFYRPLHNAADCHKCHDPQKTLLGATKVTVSLREIYRSSAKLILGAVLWSLFGVALMGGILWLIIRRLVITPVGHIREAAVAIAGGDLTVDAPVRSRDEIGELWNGLRGSVRLLGGVITRINAVARRVTEISAKTELESAEVVNATSIEAASFDHIAASIQELNASIGEISTEIESLAAAAETVHAASQETAANTAEVLRRSAELSGSVSEASSTVGEMSHTIRELSWGTAHLSEVSKETLAAVQGVERIITSVESRARESAEYSARVRREAEELGLGSVQRTLEGMERIRDTVQKAAGFIDSLGRRSQQIGEIVDVIDEVNDRTGLLALNAAILAAQAGKHGAGFQVVAGEIRKLAVRTASSTIEIAELIRNVRAEVAGAVASMRDGLEKVDSGFENVRESGTALRKIVESSRVSTEKATSIQDSTAEQSRGLATVRETMARLEQMAQFLAQGTAEQKREADSVVRTMELIVEAAERIRVSNEEQTLAGRHITVAAEQVSSGVQRISSALREEKEGCGQIMHALVRVVDLPRQNRGLALRINQGLRTIHGDTELLQAEVEQFRVLPEEQSDSLRFGVVPLESPAAMHRRFTPLGHYLARTLGRPVELKVALDFDEAVRDLGEGRTLIAYLTPSTFVQARTRYGVSLVATALRNGKPYQHAAIVVRRESGVQSLADLRGKTFAFGDPNSTSSHIVPRALLLDAGVPLEQLAGVEYLGHHDAVARAILNGEYDAGAVMESVARTYEAEGLKVLVQSPPIPEFNICASPQLGDAEKGRVRAALLALKPDTEEGKTVLGTLYRDYTGFTAGQESEYDAVRQMMQRLNLMGERS